MSKLSESQIENLKSIASQFVESSDDIDFTRYGSDETEDFCFLPDIVVKPADKKEISQILAFCNAGKIPVTIRGGGTGLSGGALPTAGGIVLSMERFNKIIHIDERNLQARVEPGVITQVFQEAVIERGLYYPPDPSSRGSCFIGGNIAHNSGGPRAVKYGVTKDFVLSLEVVLADGSIIETGANVLKNSTGYNLTQLMVGSEGTLGVVTAITFKLIPYPAMNKVMLAPFHHPEKACEAVSAIFRAGVIPSALEFMERDAIDWTLQFKPDIAISISPEEQAHLLIEVDGNEESEILIQCEKIFQVLEAHEAGEILFAESETQKADLWKLRRNVAEAVKSNSVYKEEDTVVPRAELPKLLKGVKEIGQKYGFRSICYGHAGDGNLHVNIIKGDLSDEFWENELPKGIREIFELTVSLGGTLSGEHGIGYVQRPYMDIRFPEHHLRLMRDIKKVFDPNEILNPGKIF
ncbi:MAG: FAD-binding oxidoreductase [Flavobacteriales bacterium]